jgi:hypothetical protein
MMMKQSVEIAVTGIIALMFLDLKPCAAPATDAPLPDFFLPSENAF